MQIDIFVSPGSALYIALVFCQCGRVENDQVEGALDIAQILEDIGDDKIILGTGKTVEFAVALCQFESTA